MNPAAAPACSSTATWRPAFSSGGTAAGTSDTRVSPGHVSFGTPTLIAGKSSRSGLGDRLFFQPYGDAVGDLGIDRLVGERGILADFTGAGMNQEMVDAGEMDHIDRSGFLARAGQFRKLLGIARRDLCVQIAL